MEYYYLLDELVDMIDEPNRSCVVSLHRDNKDLFQLAKGSMKNHQDWVGGYLDHLTETMNIATQFYSKLGNFRALPFTLSDAILVLDLHDLEKPWKYDEQSKIKEEFKEREYIKQFVDQKIAHYGFQLHDEHRNALLYIEGELGMWSPDGRKQGPLAAFVHCCDTLSARLWWNEPKVRGRW